MEYYQEIIQFIQSYDSPEQALQAAKHTTVPRRFKKAKKLLCKAIRKYIYVVKKSN